MLRMFRRKPDAPAPKPGAGKGAAS
jgi:hypothetical protein